MKKIIILGGGDSSEREISLSTSQTIKKVLSEHYDAVTVIDPADFEGFSELIGELLRLDPEIVFIGLHGSSGEDGRLQALFELCKIPFTGSGSHASALAMDKLASLSIAESRGIATAKRVILQRDDHFKVEDIISELGIPFVVKPNQSGSSVGIEIIDTELKAKSAIETAFEHDRIVICEQYIEGRELTVTILGEEVLPVVEIKPYKGWYDYRNKYTSGNTEYICPAELSETETQKVQKAALRIFNCLGCEIYGRVDFRYDGRKFYFLEVNTLPGMTSLSLTPMAAKAAGYKLSDLLENIIRLSKARIEE